MDWSAVRSKLRDQKSFEVRPDGFVKEARE
jgi:hypothetical protein